jgi:hypothetical protein
MARNTKAQREAERFRLRVVALLAELDWFGYEHIRRWLEKLLSFLDRRSATEDERAAVERIVAARTSFSDWDGYSVPELVTAAARYMADHSYEQECFLKELQERNATHLFLDDMRQLVDLCRMAGLDLARFRPEIEPFEEAA